MKKLAMICLAAGMCYLALSAYNGRLFPGAMQSWECTKYAPDGSCKGWA